MNCCCSAPVLFLYKQVPEEQTATQEKAPEVEKPADDKKKKKKQVEVVEDDIMIEETRTAESAPTQKVKWDLISFCPSKPRTEHV